METINVFFGIMLALFAIGFVMTKNSLFIMLFVGFVTPLIFTDMHIFHFFIVSLQNKKPTHHDLTSLIPLKSILKILIKLIVIVVAAMLLILVFVAMYQNYRERKK